MADSAAGAVASPASPPDAANDVLYEGDLEKRGQVIRNWRARYVILWRSGPKLQYFIKDSGAAFWTPKAFISLSGVAFCELLSP